MWTILQFPLLFKQNLFVTKNTNNICMSFHCSIDSVVCSSTRCNIQWSTAPHCNNPSNNIKGGSSKPPWSLQLHQSALSLPFHGTKLSPIVIQMGFQLRTITADNWRWICFQAHLCFWHQVTAWQPNFFVTSLLWQELLTWKQAPCHQEQQ